jgi:hypothetical protein
VHNAKVRGEDCQSLIHRQFLRLTTTWGLFLEVAYSQHAGVDEPLLSGASPANAHGGVIHELSEVVAAKRPKTSGEGNWGTYRAKKGFPANLPPSAPLLRIANIVSMEFEGQQIICDTIVS